MSGMRGNFGFGNVEFVSGVGFVQANGGTSPVGSLGDESAVMMINGLGEARPTGQTQSISVISGSFDRLKMVAAEKYKFFGIELPLWMWLLVASGAVGAGYILFRKYVK